MEFPQTLQIPWADIIEVKNEYNIDLKQLNDIKNVDCLVLAVAHDEFKNYEFT